MTSLCNINVTVQYCMFTVYKRSNWIDDCLPDIMWCTLDEKSNFLLFIPTGNVDDT